MLKIDGEADKYSFYASFDQGENWYHIAERLDATHLSTDRAGGFVGTTIGPYASSAHRIPSLASVFGENFDIGVAVSPNHLQGYDKERVARHFNSLTAENAMKPSSVLRPGFQYDFTVADRIVRFAREHGMKVRGHTLVWHNQTPEWFFTDDNGVDVDKETLYRRMDEYIRTVAGRYREDLYCWDVVNEAISDTPGESIRTDSPWYRICGKDYIEQAFRTAREVLPEAKLFYNDYGLLNPEKRKHTYEMLKELLEKGTPIDGIGLQGHWSSRNINKEVIRETIDLFASLGLEVQITELDLSVYGQNSDPQVEWSPELDRMQADAYRAVFEVLLEKKDVLSAVTFWGLADNYTWLDNFPVKNRKDYPFLFDRQLQPKKSFFEVISLK